MINYNPKDWFTFIFRIHKADTVRKLFIKKFIFFYVMSMPFGYVFSLGYLIIPMIVFIFFVLASLELIAEEIEDPFGHDANDLPLDNICSNIRLHVSELL